MSHAPPDTAPAPGTEVVHVDASFEPLMANFLTNRRAEVLRLQDALAARDFDAIRKITHGMKGVGGSYGFDRVTEIAATIEQAARAEDAWTIEQELPVLRIYLACVEVIYD